jgi:hypothetical protein
MNVNGIGPIARVIMKIETKYLTLVKKSERVTLSEMVAIIVF